MQGREEQDLRTKEYIENYLKDKPEILKLYNDGLYDMTYTTRKVYIVYIYKFLEYSKLNYNINPFNIDDYKTLRLFHFNSYVEQMSDYSDTYRATTVYSLKHFFRFLYDNEFIISNPTEKLKAPKDKKLHKITSLNVDEIYTLKSNILNGVGSNRQIKQNKKWMNRDICIILLGLMNGLRISAIVGINLEDINFNENKIKLVEKGNTEREILVSDSLMIFIKEWIRDRNNFLKEDKSTTNALFISQKGKQRISTDGVRNLLKKYTYNIEKHITPHKLRSTCATNLYNKTGDIYLTADILGHKNIQNTRRYANISDSQRKRAIDIMEEIVI